MVSVGVLGNVMSVGVGGFDAVISVVGGMLDDVISGVLTSVTVGVSVLIVSEGVLVGSTVVG